MIDIFQNWEFEYGKDDFASPIEFLMNHSRINYNVNEYVYSFIEEKILDKNDIIIQELNHEFLITINTFNKNRKKMYLKHSPYNTVNIKFDYDIYVGDRNIGKSKKDRCYVRMNSIVLYYYSKKISEDMSSKEYADIVYDMIGAYLINEYNFITKEIMDKNKEEMDYTYIDKFNKTSKKRKIKSIIQTNFLN